MPSRRSPSQRSAEGRQGRAMSALSIGANAGRLISAARRNASGRPAITTASPNSGDSTHDGSGTNSTAVGTSATATQDSATALGDGAAATSDQTTALGRSAQTSTSGSTVVGYLAKSVSGTGRDVAIGWSAESKATNGIAIGRSAVVQANATQAVAVGREAQVLASSFCAIALGYLALANSEQGIAIGRGAVAGPGSGTPQQYQIAIGPFAQAQYLNDAGTAAVLGVGEADGQGAIVVGHDAEAFGYEAVALGGNVQVVAHKGTAVGGHAGAYAPLDVAVGQGSVASAHTSSPSPAAPTDPDYGIVIGGATAVGARSSADGVYSTAVGYKAKAAGVFTSGHSINPDYATAIGAKTVINQTHKRAVAIGYGATTKAADTALLKADSLEVEASSAAGAATFLILTDSAGVRWKVGVSTAGALTVVAA